MRIASLHAALVLGLLGSSARADIGLLPIDVAAVDPARGPELRSALEVEVADVLKRRLVKVSPGRGCGAGFVEECARELAASTKASLDEVAWLRVAPLDGGGWSVEISVRETSDGRRVFHETVAQRPGDGAGVVGASLRRALDPPAWSGRIVLEGGPPDAEVLIDGLRVTGPTAVRVGTHQVRVRTADGSVHLFDAEVKHGDITTVPFRLPQGSPAPSLTPALVLGGVGVVATGAVAAFAGVGYWNCCVAELADGSGQLDYEYRLANARTGSLDSSDSLHDPRGEGWDSGYGTAQSGGLTQAALMAQSARAHSRFAELQTAVDIYGAAAVVAGVVAVAATVGTFLAWPAAPSEDGGEPAP